MGLQMGKKTVKVECTEVNTTVSVGTGIMEWIPFHAQSPGEIQLQVYSMEPMVKMKIATKQANMQIILIFWTLDQNET